MTYLDFQGINAAALRNARTLLPRLIPASFDPQNTSSAILSGGDRDAQ